LQVDIPYGKNKIKVEIPEPCKILIPRKVKTKNQKKIFENALKNPIDKKPIKDFIEESERLLIIVNDATKPTPTARILEYLYPFIINHADVVFLIATGTHRDPTEDEYRYIFGKFYDVFKKQIFVHNARKTDNLKYIGKTKNGTEVSINKMIFEVVNVLVIGSVEPHYFAGYTGGRKSIIPGIASYQTVEANHKMAMNSKAHSLALKDNPIHEDMMESVKFLEKLNIFSIQTVLTIDHEIYAVTAGDLNKSFYEAVEYAKQIYGVPLNEKANIVISVAPYPMDINLYQSQHALENGSLALEENGVIILVSKCRKGVGNDDFLKLLSKSDSHQGIMNIINDKYKLGDHKAARITKIGTWAHMWAVTDLDDETIKKSHLKPYKNIQSAIDDAVELIKKKVKQPKTIVMQSGNLTVPLI